MKKYWIDYRDEDFNEGYEIIEARSEEDAEMKFYNISNEIYDVEILSCEEY